MPQSIRVFQVDAFTSERFSGNPAGVVLDADGLSDAQMQALARELNNGDSIFLLSPDGPDHDVRARFFTPRKEAAFVGHATLAAHAVLASLGLPPRPRQKQQTGIVDIDLLGTATPARIAIHQPPPPAPCEPDARALASVFDALSLRHDDLDPRCPPMIAGKGSTRLLIGVRDGAVLARLTPDLTALAHLSETVGAPGYFLYSLRPSQADVFTESRMFCPALGIPEDPVSGNAHALLGAYLLQHDLLTSPAAAEGGESIIEFTGAQGHYMGRPGRVAVVLSLEQDLLQSISIIGEAVIVFQTELKF